MNRKALILFGLAFTFSLIASPVFSQQDDIGYSEDLGFPVQDWLLGDVVSLDLENNTLTLGFVDYSDAQKEITIAVAPDTKYENIDTFADIEVGDVVGIDYEINSQGENIALKI
ncbi:MAG: hypothetical protein ABIC18_00665, partial [Candidatus Omnitrophota bacterium]